MKSIGQTIGFSIIGYLIMILAAKLFWLAYPYPENPTQEEINLVWGIHILAEKLSSHFIIIVLSIFIVFNFKQKYGLKSILLAVLGAVSYNVIGGVVWILQFGYEPYFEHSLPFQLLVLVVTISLVISGISYKWLPNKPLKRD